MPDDVIFVCDTPRELASSESPSSQVQIAKTGSGFNDPRYGRFAITPADFDAWEKSLSLRADGTVPLDFDHAIEKPSGSSEAAGWVTGLQSDGARLFAKVEWTPAGAEAVRSKRYKFISPAFGAWRDENGRIHKNVLRSVTLTNRPFLDMPAVSLSAEPLFATEEPSDSRTRMPEKPTIELSKLTEALSLDTEADEAKVLDALKERGEKVTTLEDEVKTLKEAAEGDPDTRTLDQHARDEDKVVLDRTAHDALKAGADAGVRAEKALSEQKFETHFTKALENGCVDALPETKELWKGQYDENADGALKLLDSLQPIVNTKPKGSGHGEDDVPEGYDRDSFQLDKEVKAYMNEHNEEDYSVALDKVLTEKEEQAVAA